MGILFTNDMARVLVEELFKKSDNDILLHNDNEVKSSTLLTELNPLFYTYQKDELARGFYGSNEEVQENYIETIAQSLEQTKCLVELTKNEPLAVQDFIGGNVSLVCTFFLPTNKIAVLDALVSKMRANRSGDIEYKSFTIDNKDISTIYSVGALEIQDYSFTSPLGISSICTLTIDMGYMEYCSFYGDNYIELSLDNTTWYQVPLIKFDIAMSYTTQANTTQNNPKAIGDISTSASISMNLTYYEFKDNEVFEKIRLRCLAVCATEYQNNYEDDINLNNVVYVRYNHDGGDYTYKMIVRSYATSGTNADFMQASLSLGLSAT